MRLVGRVFSNWEYMWLVDELQRNLPQELDFLAEKNNSDRLRGLLGQPLLSKPSKELCEHVTPFVVRRAVFWRRDCASRAARHEPGAGHGVRTRIPRKRPVGGQGGEGTRAIS